jgi:uncharacterized tellurite resistance protein B-like protein
MKKFKMILGCVLLGIAVITLLLYFFTDLINWNYGGWLSWLLSVIGGALCQSVDDKEDKEKLDKEEKAMTASEKANLRLLQNLYAVAAADGKVQGEESVYIIQTMKEVGMDGEEVLKQLNRCQRHGYSIVKPSDDDERGKHLSMMVGMMMIDGKASKSELEKMKNIAVSWGYNSSIVDQIVENLENDEDFQELISKTKQLVKENKIKTVDA